MTFLTLTNPDTGGVTLVTLDELCAVESSPLGTKMMLTPGYDVLVKESPEQVAALIKRVCDEQAAA